MKKIEKIALLCAISAYASSSFALPDAESKYYLEGALGISNMHARGYFLGQDLPAGSSADITGPEYVWDLRTGPQSSVSQSVGFAGSASLGYDHRFCDSRMMVGAFFGGGGTGAHCDFPYIGATYTGVYGVDNPSHLVQSAFKVHDKGFFTVGVRGGVAMGPVFAFLRVGYAPHSVSFKIDRPDTQFIEGSTTELYTKNVKKSFSRWIGTTLVGIGVDINITRRLIVGLLVEGHFGGQKKYKIPENVIARSGVWQTPHVKLKPSFGQYLVTVKYAMPTCR